MLKINYDAKADYDDISCDCCDEIAIVEIYDDDPFKCGGILLCASHAAQLAAVAGNIQPGKFQT